MPSTFKGDPNSVGTESGLCRASSWKGRILSAPGGALARVYLNIGTYSEQWERLHNTLLGFRGQKPFKLKTAKRTRSTGR